MLIDYVVYDGTNIRVTLDEFLEHEIFLGMMEKIRVMRHVLHDVQHQYVIAGSSSLQTLNLVIKKFEQRGDICVLFAQLLNGFRH